MDEMTDGQRDRRTDRNTRKRIDEGQICVTRRVKERGNGTVTAGSNRTILSERSGLVVMENVLSAPSVSTVH